MDTSDCRCTSERSQSNDEFQYNLRIYFIDTNIINAQGSLFVSHSRQQNEIYTDSLEQRKDIGFF